MKARAVLPEELRRLGASRSGVLFTHELLAAGLTRGGVRGMLGSRLYTLAYGAVSLWPPSWETAAWFGVLRGGPGAVLGGEASLHLDGLVRREPETLTVWLPGTRDREDVACGSWRIAYRHGDRPFIGQLPRLPVGAGLVDYARDATEDELIAAAARALAERRITTAELERAFTKPLRVRHRDAVLLLASSGEGIESILEWRYLWYVERAHRLPPLTRQHQPFDGIRLDGAYPGYRLAVELDGREFHDGATDSRRDNNLALNLGWTTLRYGWSDVVRHPCRVAFEVARALRQRGWDGFIRRCHQCFPRSPPPRFRPNPDGVTDYLDSLRLRTD